MNGIHKCLSTVEAPQRFYLFITCLGGCEREIGARLGGPVDVTNLCENMVGDVGKILLNWQCEAREINLLVHNMRGSR